MPLDGGRLGAERASTPAPRKALSGEIAVTPRANVPQWAANLGWTHPLVALIGPPRRARRRRGQAPPPPSHRMLAARARHRPRPSTRNCRLPGRRNHHAVAAGAALWWRCWAHVRPGMGVLAATSRAGPIARGGLPARGRRLCPGGADRPPVTWSCGRPHGLATAPRPALHRKRRTSRPHPALAIRVGGTLPRRKRVRKPVRCGKARPPRAQLRHPLARSSLRDPGNLLPPHAAKRCCAPG